MADTTTSANPILFRVGVYRVQIGDTNTLSLERHQARAAALRAEFTQDDDVQVLDWGDNDDPQPHEFVELLVEVVSSPAVQAAVTSVITWIGMKLAEKAVDEAITAGFKTLARRIFRTQRSDKRVSDAWLKGRKGSPTVELFPPEWGPGGKTSLPSCTRTVPVWNIIRLLASGRVTAIPNLPRTGVSCRSTAGARHYSACIASQRRRFAATEYPPLAARFLCLADSQCWPGR